jgi:hypothetical protein
MTPSPGGLAAGAGVCLPTIVMRIIDVGSQRESDAASSSRADLTSVPHTATAHARDRGRFAEMHSCGNKRRSRVLIGEEERSR